MGQLAHLTSPPARAVRNLILRLLPDRVNQRQVEGLYQLDF
jgi:hypothetical protein